MELTDQPARKLGAILGGAFFKPAVVEELEAVFGNLLIDWVTLGPASPGAGKTIGELQIRRRTGVTVVAIVREAMEHPYELDVPLVVNVGVGGSWAEAH